MTYHIISKEISRMIFKIHLGVNEAGKCLHVLLMTPGPFGRHQSGEEVAQMHIINSLWVSFKRMYSSSKNNILSLSLVMCVCKVETLTRIRFNVPSITKTVT